MTLQFESLYISARAIIIQVSIKMKMILFVIDTQKGITDERLFEFEKFKSNVGTLIAAAIENPAAHCVQLGCALKQKFRSNYYIA